MGSICLSSASILRCASLTQLQNILLIIPTALEVIFSTSLIFVNWKGGRRHLLLTAEGWIYLALSVIGLLSNILPGVRDNLSVFRAFDLGIGVASFLPIFLYTFFYFILTSNELVETLPNRLKNVAKLSLILFVPAIITFNEIASFVGVTIRNIPPPDNPASTQTMIAIGFTSNREETLWAFFTNVTLTLLVVFQAAVFCFAFFRLCRALLHQRRIENEGSDKAHFVNGTGWLCAAAKLGALESVVGFAGGGFGIAFTRRIMRMLARACLCQGLVKGVDAVEDFNAVQRELTLSKTNSRGNQRASRLLQFISNPRSSTFRPLSPTATAFHAAPRAPANFDSKFKDSSLTNRPHYLTWTQRQSQLTIQSGLPGMRDFASIKEKQIKQRVTVYYREGAPILHMRFSTLNLPSPAVIVESVASRPQSEWIEAYRNQTPYRSEYGSEFEYKEKGTEFQPPKPPFYPGQPGSDTYRDSLTSSPSLSGPYEIVDARKLTQMAAMAQVYQAPSGYATTTTTLNTTAVAFPEPTYQNSSPPQVQRQDTDGSRVKSMASVKSVPDTIQVVRELWSQFPGPPGLSQMHFIDNDNRAAVERTIAETPIAERSVWEEDSRTSAQHLSGAAMPQVLGSPSELLFKNRATQRLPNNAAVEGDIWYGSSLNAESSPIRAGKVPVTPGGYSRMSTSSRGKPKQRYSQKPIDPFNDDDDADSNIYQLSKTPTYVPVGTPLRQALNVNTATIPVQKSLKSGIPVDVDEAPSTGLSEISRLRESVVDTQADPFLDLGTALDTGKSRQFRPSQPMPQPQVPVQTPITARKMSKTDEKLSRIAEWVDTSANVAVARGSPEIPVTPIVESLEPMQDQDRPRDNSLQNLHDRGKSMDALAIPWLKNPDVSDDDARRLGQKMPSSFSSSAMQPQLSRIKSVGKAPSRVTPAPVHIAHTRGSLYLQPIMIPPRNGTMPQAVQIEYGSWESASVGRGVLTDLEVLEMEDSVEVEQQGRNRF
ncbi:hypothetical protein BDZ97DRAFT_1921786 [Flammula alnicola]|nr:hypothetical protein BDZ97DRAFT_1921786 [Flammula alnicola]